MPDRIRNSRGRPDYAILAGAFDSCLNELRLTPSAHANRPTRRVTGDS
jgi:hypothetical protein